MYDDFMKYETLEEGIEKLKKHVNTRRQMGGALHYNIVNDECQRLASDLICDGANPGLVTNILDGEVR